MSPFTSSEVWLARGPEMKISVASQFEHLAAQLRLSRLLGVSLAGLGLALTSWRSPSLAVQSSRFTANLGQSADALQAQIIIHYPHDPYHHYPYEPYYHPPRRQVEVEFVALGREWATVILDGRRIFRPHNHNRRRRFTLEEGVYYLEITGVTRFEVWDSGYLDVGRSGANILVVTFSKKDGVRVSGDPNSWIPDVLQN
ncbi:MAG: hypothetical protein QNJ46_16845 [Leptolyngbyaceae cyanobacterium MO_188.B28]|nr:hypothetical protein [Leptolyngbyaceae cyanobacterium MO_188.B28]